MRIWPAHSGQRSAAGTVETAVPDRGAHPVGRGTIDGYFGERPVGEVGPFYSSEIGTHERLRVLQLPAFATARAVRRLVLGRARVGPFALLTSIRRGPQP